MSDLRAAVKGLPTFGWRDRPEDEGATVKRSAVLALIPEGAVLVTEETLAAAMLDTHTHGKPAPEGSARREWQDQVSAEDAADILRHLREAPE